MRQLQLFSGKRQRGIAPPPALEFNAHCFVADVCKRWIMPGWRFTHLPLGEKREHKLNSKGKRYSPSGSRLKRMGVSAGWPDFLFAGPEARVIWVELKRKKRGRLSKDQSDITEHLKACGFAVLVTTSTDEAIEFLKSHGVLRSCFEVQ